MKKILQSFKLHSVCVGSGILTLALIVVIGLSCGVLRKDRREVIRIHDGEVVVIDTTSFKLDLFVVRSADTVLTAVLSPNWDCDKHISRCDNHSRIRLNDHYSLTLTQWQKPVWITLPSRGRMYYYIPRRDSVTVDTLCMLEDHLIQQPIYQAREIVCMEYCSPEEEDGQ